MFLVSLSSFHSRFIKIFNNFITAVQYQLRYQWIGNTLFWRIIRFRCIAAADGNDSDIAAADGNTNSIVVYPYANLLFCSYNQVLWVTPCLSCGNAYAVSLTFKPPVVLLIQFHWIVFFILLMTFECSALTKLTIESSWTPLSFQLKGVSALFICKKQK